MRSELQALKIPQSYGVGNVYLVYGPFSTEEAVHFYSGNFTTKSVNGDSWPIIMHGMAGVTLPLEEAGSQYDMRVRCVRDKRFTTAMPEWLESLKGWLR